MTLNFSIAFSEFGTAENVFVNAYPWLFPGGVGDLYDPIRGQTSLKAWANHLLKYHDGRFLKDQLFCLYVHNTIQRHKNNTEGNFFFNNKHWLGANPPTLEDLKEQIRQGDFRFVSKLRYFSQSIRGSDGYWRSKTNELKSWIDYHVSRGHGPPTHFITLTCAENWWPDLYHIMNKLDWATKHTFSSEDEEFRDEGICDNVRDFKRHCKRIREHSLYVNEYFMKRAREFMEGYAREVLGVEHYWGRVEFASGRGQIHLHILGIARNMGYLTDFYQEKREEKKSKFWQNMRQKSLE